MNDLSTMKRLYVVRHGKSEPHGSKTDADRELTPRGIQDSVHLGTWTKDVRQPGSPLWVSPAIRTLQTASTLCQTWNESTDAMEVQEGAYLASDRAWLSWIVNWNDAHETGWIVGHNPGVSDLVERLTEQSIWMPTCGLAEIELQVNGWEEVFAGTGRLRGMFTPKSIFCP